jgi:multiple sugar transport system ATP-binding protein
MSSVVLADVTKSYADDVTVLSHFDLEIRDGELLVIVGPSGCGKSTVLRIIAGLERITEGTVWFDDTDMTDVPPQDRNVSMVFQSGSLYPARSVRRNLSFPLEVQGMDRRRVRAQVEAEARHLGILPLLDRMPATLSQGQRHAVATGRALLQLGSVLLMDEPLASLDPRTRQQVRGEITTLHRELGVTTVYVTNDAAEALAIGERVAVLNPNGELVQLGTPKQAFHEPNDVFVAQFLGLMTILPARVHPSNGGWTMEVLGQPVALSPRLLNARPQLADYAGRPLLMGARPSAIRAVGASFSGPVLRGKVTFVEYLGPGMIIHARADDQSFIATGPPDDRARAGTTMTFVVDPARLMFFDPDSRQLLSSPVRTEEAHCFLCDRSTRGPICPHCGAATWVDDPVAPQAPAHSAGAEVPTLDTYLGVPDPIQDVVQVVGVPSGQPVPSSLPSPIGSFLARHWRWLVVLVIIAVVLLGVVLAGGQ